MGKHLLVPPSQPSCTYYTQRGYAVDKGADNDALIAYLRKLLTVEPKVSPDAPAGTAAPFPVYRESSKKFYIPRALGFELFGPPRVDGLHDGADAHGLQFAGSLRQEQQPAIDAFLEAARDPARQGGIISLQCGGGKTVCGLYLACVLKKSTLIICHKEFLIAQWRERIAQFIPTATVGIIKAKKTQVANSDGTPCDIVLASLQSLSMKSYPESLFQQFGLVICDECHHLSAEVFSQALPKVTARVFLGLSATLDRKDGLRKVFEWFLGKPVFEMKKRLESQMIVRVVPFEKDYTNKEHARDDYGETKFLWNGKRNVAAMLNAICAFKPRNDRIMAELEAVLSKEPGRRTLILSDRRNHLKELERMIKARGLCGGQVGYYVGGMKEADLKASEDMPIILATYAMASEGMDIPALNTLVLASPVSAIEQPIGRIQRQKPAERTHTPLTIDLWDTFGLYKAQGFRRMKFYKKSGYAVHMEGGNESDESGAEESEDEQDQRAQPKRQGKQKEAIPDFEDDESDEG